jgi:hypothetical protein
MMNDIIEAVPRKFSEGLDEGDEKTSNQLNRCPAQDLKRTPREYKPASLPVYQNASSNSVTNYWHVFP